MQLERPNPMAGNIAYLKHELLGELRVCRRDFPFDFTPFLSGGSCPGEQRQGERETSDCMARAPC
jgi:hypothetical protein